MHNRLRHISFLLLFILLSACATTVRLSMEQLREQYPELAKLEKNLDEARARGKDILAPESYQIALDAYIKGYNAAQENQRDLAVQSAREGMTALDAALQTAQTSEKILSEVLEARSRARKAGADKFYVEQMKKLDEDLTKIGQLIDNRQIEKAKARRPELQNAYLDLELAALKQSTIASAQKAIDDAKANDAQKYAPKTLTNAQEELTLAQSVLEVDRTNRDKANAHANRATVLAKRSMYIAAVLKDFKRRDGEDIVLAYQNELSKFGQAMDHELLFDKPNDETVLDVRNTISALYEANSDNKRRALELEAELSRINETHQQQLINLKQQHARDMAQLESKYTGEISMLGKTQDHLARMHEEQRARFERVQSLFNDKEANVYRQKNNVLISVHGFKFPVGSAEIKPANFALMNKIVKAIGEFKSSKIIVSGHTDSTGSADANKMLSNNRAKNVAKFFIEVGGIDGKRIQAKGFGQEKPVASNLTAEGRALNRRVEILIVNSGR
jgi:outer membrane protein OmpA-like peptidoglycan-associated protein